MPCVLVSCKCDAPLSNRRIDPQEVEQLCMEETGIEVIQTSADAPETHKRCISIVLRNFITEPVTQGRPNGVRPRAMTTTNMGSSTKPQGKRSKHGRATSELTSSTQTKDTVAGKAFTHHSRPALTNEPEPETPEPPISEHKMEDSEDETVEPYSRNNRPAAIDLHDLQFRPQPKGPMGTPTTIANSFIDFGGSDNENEDTEERESQQSEPETTEQVPNPGSTFEELVDKLLAQPVSKADAKFVATFLCLYRKFAAPTELFSSILQRFEAAAKSSMPQLIKLSTQLRYLAILAQWVCEYPGDFAHPFIHSHILDFVRKISSNRVFAVAASEMSTHLESVQEDDDTNWACSDYGRGRNSAIKTLSRVPSLSASMSTLLTKSQSSPDVWSDYDRSVKEKGHNRSVSTVSSHERRTSASGSFLSAPLHSVEDAQRQSELLIPSNRIPLSKVQWHQFIETSGEDIAREMTRIDWILYSAIRPRDLIRHVSLTPDQREQCRGLEYVTRMINQFNHIAFWVGNMVLLRDKPKHRAKALEKFMDIAWVSLTNPRRNTLMLAETSATQQLQCSWSCPCWNK
jgi:hypothetical protein